MTIFMLMFIAGFPDHFHLWVKCYVFHCLNRKLSDIFVNNRKDRSYFLGNSQTFEVDVCITLFLKRMVPVRILQ